MRVAIIGNDARQKAVYQAFAKRGYEVGLYDFPFADADIIVLPMPITSDGVTLYTTQISLTDCFSVLRSKTVYGGRCGETAINLAAQHKVRLLDHFAREEEAVLNVIPTVEGALQIALERTPFTLHGALVLVCGFGRIGKLLCHHLKALGAEVRVAARKKGDLAWCEALGYHGVDFQKFGEIVGKSDIIFNTAPALLLDRNMLEKTTALIIDLASAPGGVDFEAAAQMGKNVVQALALPVRVAPQTAGEIICKTIINMYEEENTRVR